MNQNIRKVLDAINILREVKGCELEVLSLGHRLQSMYLAKATAQNNGIALIDLMDDDELVAAIAQGEARIGMGEFIDPDCFNYLRRNRPGLIERADLVRRGQCWA